MTSQTCIPDGPKTSKAATTLETKFTTLVKLSSPMLQEPSMRNTTSALAPLQTVAREHVRLCVWAQRTTLMCCVTIGYRRKDKLNHVIKGFTNKTSNICQPDGLKVSVNLSGCSSVIFSGRSERDKQVVYLPFSTPKAVAL